MPVHSLIRHKFDINANDIMQLDFIYREIATRMVSRLDYIKLIPHAILDIGAGLSIDAKLLKEKYPKSQIYKIDLSINMLKQYNKSNIGWNKLFRKNKHLVCADAIQLPLASQSMDLIWSNLMLPYVNDIKAFFKEVRRVLKIGGTFLVTGLGVDSLKQLRTLGLITHDFPDMHEIGDILAKLGFTNPVTDVEYITLEYDEFNQLLTDIRLIGCGAAYPKFNRLTKAIKSNLIHKVAKLSKNNKIPLTLEVFYAHAWKDKIQLELNENKKVIQFYPTN